MVFESGEAQCLILGRRGRCLGSTIGWYIGDRVGSRCVHSRLGMARADWLTTVRFACVTNVQSLRRDGRLLDDLHHGLGC